MTKTTLPRRIPVFMAVSVAVALGCGDGGNPPTDALAGGNPDYSWLLDMAPADTFQAPAGTWFDGGPGLFWLGKPGPSSKWQASADYCSTLDFAGYSDWRLPTLGELRSAIRGCDISGCSAGDKCLGSSCYSVYCDRHTRCSAGMGTTYSGGSWSSSAVSDRTGSHWYLDFGAGQIGMNGDDELNSVYCVRK